MDWYKAGEDAIEAGMYLGGLPGGQIKITVGNAIESLNEGVDYELRDFFFTRQK